MANVSNPRIFKHVSSTHKLETNLVNLLTIITQCRGVYSRSSIIPTIIGVCVNYDGDINHLPPIRQFLMILKKYQINHFVRFTTELLWATQVDAAHTFYTYDGNNRDLSDISISVNILENGYISLTGSLYPTSKNHCAINELVRSIKNFPKYRTFPSDFGGIENFSQQVATMVCGHVNMNDLDSNVHIVIVSDPLPDGSYEWYPVPLVGINSLDGNRRYRRSMRDIETLYDIRCDTLFAYETPTPFTVVDSLIGMLQDQERLRFRAKDPMITYGYAETLFSFGTSSGVNFKSLSQNEIMIFCHTDSEAYPFYQHSSPVLGRISIEAPK